MRTRLPLVLAIALGLALPVAATAQSEADLPDIGSSAGELITPRQESQYGAMYLRELRRAGYVLDDPLVESWLHGLGYRIAAASQRDGQDYTFFLMRSRQINAFATLGGYIGTNAGLILTAENEDEVAAVLAHEIAHVTQRHIVRAVERARKDQIPIMLGMLAAVIAAQQSGSSSDGATQAAIAGGMGLMQQRQINYTRANEHESDRIGIQTLARAGYDPEAMAVFFGRLQRTYRTLGYEGYVPDYLRSHPVTTTRISEARDRAQQMTGAGTAGGTALGAGTFGPANPLLPEHLNQADLVTGDARSGLFEWARERLRVLSADSPARAISEYERLRENAPGGLSDAQRYGLALARTQTAQTGAALEDLEDLHRRHPANHWAALALAEAEYRAGRQAAARARFDRLTEALPTNRAVALTYAGVLGEIGTPEAGRRAQAVLRPLLVQATGDVAFQRTFGRASEIAGDHVRAGEAHAEAAFLSGRAEDALNQLEALKQRDDLDYIQRARIDARISAITPIVLEMRRQGLGPNGRRGPENMALH